MSRSPDNFTIRAASASDADALLSLMRELAIFEGYINDFCVTSSDLLARSLATELPEKQREFNVFVASINGNELLGYAVVYRAPFTYDLRANLVLKELYVSLIARGSGLGHDLMSAVLGYARDHDCARLKWDVLPDNFLAKKFYQSIGGAPDTAWENWILRVD